MFIYHYVQTHMTEKSPLPKQGNGNGDNIKFNIDNSNGIVMYIGFILQGRHS